MSAIYLEKKTYKKKDLAVKMGIDPTKANLQRTIETKLKSMGFEKGGYKFTRTEAIILWEPQSTEERLNYLLRAKNIKVENTRDFTIFYSCLMNFEEYQYCPWQTRAELLKESYGCTTDWRKLQNWGGMLLDAGMVIKTGKTDKKVWTSYYIDGEKHQEEVDMEDEQAAAQYKEYWATFWEKLNHYKEHPEDIIETDKYGRKLKASSQAQKDCWRQFGCCYYSYQNFVRCAWSSDEEEEEIREIVDAYMEMIETA